MKDYVGQYRCVPEFNVYFKVIKKISDHVYQIAVTQVFSNSEATNYLNVDVEVIQYSEVLTDPDKIKWMEHQVQLRTLEDMK
jgi:hypothetical protein